MTDEHVQLLSKHEEVLKKILDGKYVTLTYVLKNDFSEAYGEPIPCNCGGTDRRKAALKKIATDYFASKGK